MKIGMTIIILTVLASSFVVFSAYWISYWIRCFRDYIRRLKCVEACEDTFYKVKSLGFLIGVSGEVGSFKTATVVGCSPYDSLNYIEEAKKKIEWIQTVVPYVDYNYVFKVIDLLYETSGSPRKVYEGALQDENIKKWFHGIYDDYVNKTPLPSLLRTLIDARCALLRNQFVGSNIRIFNPITQTFSFEFDYSNLEIKQEDSRENYLFPKYLTVIEDEALLSIYKNTNSNTVVGDTGLDTALRLYRHLSKETSRLYSTAQVISRVSKIVRENSTDFIHMMGGEIIGSLKTKDRRLKRKEEKLREKILRKNLSDYPSRWKNRQFRIHQKRKRIYAGCYLKTYGIHYTVLEDVGRKIENCQGFAEEIEFVFPLTWVFGCYDTHEFSIVDETLEKISNRTELDLKVMKETLSDIEKKKRVDSILKKINPEEEAKKAEKKQKAEAANVRKRAFGKLGGEDR